MTDMQANKFAPLVLRFYARCLLFPYEEMTYELQHIFRQIEFHTDNVDDLVTGHEILAVVNTFQGEDIQVMRADYVFLFSNRDQSDPVCPMLASEFASRFNLAYDSGVFVDLLYEREYLPGDEDSIDSVVNYLEYFASLYESVEIESISDSERENFYRIHILPWIPKFCDILHKSANISFYRELAGSLKRYLLSHTAEEFPG